MEMQRIDPTTRAVMRDAPSCFVLGDNFSFIRHDYRFAGLVITLFANDDAGSLNVFAVHLGIGQRGSSFPRKLNDLDGLLPIVSGSGKDAVVTVAGVALVEAEIQQV